MEHRLVGLTDKELTSVAGIAADGSLRIDAAVLARLASKTVGVVGLRVAVSAADYLRHDNGTPEPGTRTVSGIWWLSHGDDTALVGGFTVDGLAMTVTTEGEGPAPIAEDVAVIEKATKAIASQYEGAEVLEAGLVRVPSRVGGKPVRVVVTRDHRVRRPEDMLGVDEYAEFEAERSGLAIVQIVGGGKALVVKHGL